jgi:hypothetical protein
MSIEKNLERIANALEAIAFGEKGTDLDNHTTEAMEAVDTSEGKKPDKAKKTPKKGKIELVDAPGDLHQYLPGTEFEEPRDRRRRIIDGLNNFGIEFQQKQATDYLEKLLTKTFAERGYKYEKIEKTTPTQPKPAASAEKEAGISLPQPPAKEESQEEFDLLGEPAKEEVKTVTFEELKVKASLYLKTFKVQKTETLIAKYDKSEKPKLSGVPEKDRYALYQDFIKGLTL